MQDVRRGSTTRTLDRLRRGRLGGLPGLGFCEGAPVRRSDGGGDSEKRGIPVAVLAIAGDGAGQVGVLEEGGGGWEQRSGWNEGLTAARLM